jgi:hypothetical protein
MLRELFDAPSILRAAEDAEQTGDFWSESFREGLEALLPSLAEEAGLYPARAWRMLRLILEILGTRADIAKALKTRGPLPDMAGQRPVFITGLPRTGTTLLHNLMSGLPGFRAFRPWEMRAVVPPDGADAAWEAQAIRDTDVELRALHDRAPDLAKIHPVQVDRPDECHWLMRHSFASLIFSYLLFTPSYTRWLLARSQRAAYEEYEKQLRLLLSWRPAGRLVLKDPGHLWQLDDLLDVFPGALVVRLHRDPREAVPSLCSLMHALQRMDSSRVDPLEVGPYALELVVQGLEREKKARQRHGPSSFLDIEYRDLLRDPVAAVQRICDAAGADLPPEGIAWVTAWLGEHPQHKSGRHTYSAEQFGLNPRELSARLGEQG